MGIHQGINQAIEEKEVEERMNVKTIRDLLESGIPRELGSGLRFASRGP